jgi:glutamate synthase domain-containing protein 2/glutamate synthase domain-containing protein 1/glutamate synthase domain-containing protein 3
MINSHTIRGLPPKQGMYDPAHERDACGMGFVAQARGVRSHELVRQGLAILENMTHRGAVGADPETGDGAGILIQLPHRFLQRECAALGIALPEPGAYGVGMTFLPHDEAGEACRGMVERAVVEEGLEVLGWREVPTDATRIGEQARESRPVVAQCIVVGDGLAGDDLERKLYRVRRHAERAGVAAGLDSGDFYIASFSVRTVVYKGLLNPDQIVRFYPELEDEALESAIALIHSRFSTNTFPTWGRAHPYRMICHNGEINALRGNVNWMRVREGGMGEEVRSLFPIVGEGQSDSASVDNVLEFLVMGGRPLAQAITMLLPEAWEGNPQLDPEVRGYFEYHSAVMEPWDGPAAVAFTDGRQVGAILDRNGLRPARWLVTKDDLVVLASEAGVLPIPAADIRAKGRLGPGRVLLVDTERGTVEGDEEVKAAIAARHPYRRWVVEQQLRLDDLPEPLVASTPEAAASIMERQTAFGYTTEEMRLVIEPMITGSAEAIGSMGTDTPIAVLSDHPQLLFRYFKQLFAQVTNPPIDPIREKLVMSLVTDLGPRPSLLEETPEHARRIRLHQPVLSDADVAKLGMLEDGLRARTISALFPADGGEHAMEVALERLCGEAVSAVKDGYGVLVISDRGVDEKTASIPSLLAVSAVHHHLIREGLRTRASLVAETGEAREVNHFALLLGYGAEAVAPYLIWEVIDRMAAHGDLGMEVHEARGHYVKAVGKGLLKVLSKMGISTLQSYCGAQVFEAVGLSSTLVREHFTGTSTRIEGIGVEEVQEETLRRHRAAFKPRSPLRRLDAGGEYYYRIQSEHHNWSPLAIAKLQQATRENSASTFAEFSKLVDEEQSRFNLRGLLDLVPGDPVPLDEVEPAAEIVKRFCTGAMSFGSISREAHETLAVAMNRLGGRSNTGEGGEEPERYHGDRNSKIKQVASGRFGVTTDYLVHAQELQIKIAQGAKPGEGGQLPGYKVDAVIARTRHATPGVSLISPPPHHDIYSIEDLAQLIHDLKTVNPRAVVSVKLVAEAGVGTVAAGVAKAHADLIVIAGDSGGTGASPLSSIKHAGIPWELGLAETQQTLVMNDLRGRVRLQTDGQLKTGRDVMVAGLLGAEEFGFATAPLIVEGCIMMRKCHLNTCPVGIATQDPVLRAKFTGQPEHVVNYFFFVASEVREWMAKLGFRTFAELVGHTERLKPRKLDHWKARTLDLQPLLHRPEVGSEVALHCVCAQDHAVKGSPEQLLLQIAGPSLENGTPVSAELSITNRERAVGATLSGAVARKYGPAGLPDETIRLSFTGSAGQSFGAFAVHGVTLMLEGEANDYVGKGLSGGRLAIRLPRDAGFSPEQGILVGNTVLYGATSGEAFFAGMAGERFAVRNSGVHAVVEGVGDHGCEYMTGGVVAVLGKVGRNFGAGMSGGVAYVLDETGEFRRTFRNGLMDVEAVAGEDAGALRRLLERHVAYTGSERAARLLASWDESLSSFAKVIPVEYRRALESVAPQITDGGLLAREELTAHG